MSLAIAAVRYSLIACLVADPIDLGGQLELFLDRYLIDQMTRTELASSIPVRPARSSDSTSSLALAQLHRKPTRLPSKVFHAGDDESFFDRRPPRRCPAGWWLALQILSRQPLDASREPVTDCSCVT